MPDYKLGKIYRLYVGDLTYIGATTQPMLSLRLGQHKTAYKRWGNGGRTYITSFDLFKIGTPKIELLELFPCGSKDELHAREGYHQRLNVCVNKKIAGQTREEHYLANRPRLCEQMRRYYDANQSKLNEQMKLYYVANKKKRCEYGRMRYAHNKRIERLTLFIQNHIRICC
jgi:hypothetical protein